MALDFPSSPTSGQVFQGGGASWLFDGTKWLGGQSGGGGPLAVRVFTASGTYTPTPGMATAMVECVGGGGGGGGAVTGAAGSYFAGGGGGSGGYSRRLLTAAQIGAGQSITIGANGTGGIVTNDGTAGGDTFLGASLGTALCAAKGGAGGKYSHSTGTTVGGGGAGGGIAGAVGDVTAAGAPGGNGIFGVGDATLNSSGEGGSSIFGGGGAPVYIQASAAIGNAATNYGSGGSGGGTFNAAGAGGTGGNGSAGIVIITEFGPSSNIAVATTANIRTFTASGSYSPPSNLISAIIECVGGGGGGGAATGVAGQVYAGGGGGSGSYSRSVKTAAQIGASQAITIGAGGTGGASNNGASGGDTSVGSLVIAKGGSGGLHGYSGQVGNGGAGGIAGTGDVTAAGAPGGEGIFESASISIHLGSGSGGSSVFGGGAIGVSSGAANNASNYGSGGSGGYTNNTAVMNNGGNGSPGVVIITEFIAVSAVAAPGFPVQIARVDVSSPVASVDFTSGIDATYDEYELHFFGVAVSVSNDLGIRISQDGGGTWKSGGSDYSCQASFALNPGTGIFTGSNLSYGLIGTQHTGVNGRAAGLIRFFRPGDTTAFKNFLFQATVASTSFVSANGSIVYVANLAAFNGLQLLVIGGTITAGTFILYGIKK